MTTFDKREEGFEKKFALDEELRFKANARRNKLLGLWAAEKLGKKGADAEKYAKDVVMTYLDHKGNDAMIEKLTKDMGKAGIHITSKEIRAEMERLFPIARQEIQGKSSGNP